MAFGTHAAGTAYQGPLDFAGEDEALMPVWERHHIAEEDELLRTARKMKVRYAKHLEAMGDH